MFFKGVPSFTIFGIILPPIHRLHMAHNRIRIVYHSSTMQIIHLVKQIYKLQRTIIANYSCSAEFGGQTVKCSKTGTIVSHKCN